MPDPTPTPIAECAKTGAESPETASKTAHSRGGVGRLVAVHAHPDDETLATGALLASWSRANGHATVVTCTRGEQGEVIGAQLAHLEGDGPALAAHREGELVQALAALGVEEHHYLDQLPDPADAQTGQATQTTRYQDSGMAWLPGQNTGTAAAPAQLSDGAFVAVDLDAAAGRLAAFLDRTTPDVVVTYDPGGGYGHPDHVRTHEVTMRAIELAQHARPVVLWASTTPDTLRAQRRALACTPWARTIAQKLDLAFPDVDGELPALADAGRPIAVSVQVEPVLPELLKALSAHRTQVHAITRAPATEQNSLLASYSLSNNVLAAIAPAETYAWGRADSAAQAQEAHWPLNVDRTAVR